MNRDCWAIVYGFLGLPVFSGRLRATCHLLRDGYDSAVHYGWVYVAGHDAAAPPDEGEAVTGTWARGWFPVRLAVLRPPAGGVADPSADNAPFGGSHRAVALRVEVRLGQPSPRFTAGVTRTIAAAAVVLAETAWPGAAASPALDAPVIAAIDTADLVLRLSSATTQIPDGFSFPSLRRLDLRGAAHVTSLGRGFLEGAAKLEHLCTGGSLERVVHIGPGFASRCAFLAVCDVSGLTGVRKINDDFASRCTALRAFDTAGLVNVTEISHRFLSHCWSLTAFDSAGLTNVTSLGDDFLASCNSLTSIDTCGLRSVTRIGSRFSHGCKTLAEVTTVGLSAVTSVQDSFVSRCEALQLLDASGLTALCRVGDHFGAGCDRLAHVNLRGLTALLSIGAHFLAGDGSLHAVDLTPLSSGIHVDRRGFLEGAPARRTESVKAWTRVLGGAPALEEEDEADAPPPHWALPCSFDTIVGLSCALFWLLFVGCLVLMFILITAA